MAVRRTKWVGTGNEPQVQAASKRGSVITSAANLFNERGFHLTTLDDVAAALNVTKATLYYYIKDKDEILLECYRLALVGLSEALVVIREPQRPVVERLRFFLAAFGRSMSAEYGKCLVRTGVRQLKPKSRDIIMHLVRDLEVALLGLIEEGIATGCFRPSSSKLMRNFIFGAFQGIAVWHSKEGEMDIEEIVSSYTEFVLGGIAVRDAE
jgi:AcrR family transcriptional regulator